MIYIDDRAGSAPLLHMPPFNDRAIATPSRLPSGDLMFTGNGPSGLLLIGIELKRVDELLTSQQSGRLTSQLERMQTDYARRWLVYYSPIRQDGNEFSYLLNGSWTRAVFGDPGDKSSKPVPYRYLFNLLSDIEEAGFRVVHCADLQQVISWTLCCCLSWAKPWSERKYLRVVDTSQPMPIIPRYHVDKQEHERIKLAVRLASLIPGIGTKSVRSFVRAFPSIAAMFNATISQIMSVEGFGKTRAERIHGLLHRPALDK
jgi:ERCC4-type nuclease